MRNFKIIIFYILFSFTSISQDTEQISELLKVRRDMDHNIFDKEVTNPNFSTFAMDFMDFIEKFQGLNIENIDSYADYSFKHHIKQTFELFKEKSSIKLLANQELYEIIELDYSSVDFLNDCFKYCFGYIYYNFADMFTQTIYQKFVGKYFSISNIYFAEFIYFMDYVYVYKEAFINDKNFTSVINGSLNTWLSNLNFTLIMPYVMWYIYPDIETMILLQNNTSNAMSLNN